jgi:SH3 domain protein
MADACSGKRIPAILVLALAIGGVASAEQAWIGGDVRAPVRSGPGNEFRVIDGVRTGDAVQVVERGDGWSRIRTPTGKQGWLSTSFLEPQAPPAARVAQLEAEAEKLRTESVSLREENERLNGAKQELDQRAAHLDRLEEENQALKAGARWPEWITGAAILGIGMAAGAALTRAGGRRQTRRLRL